MSGSCRRMVEKGKLTVYILKMKLDSPEIRHTKGGKEEKRSEERSRVVDRERDREETQNIEITIHTEAETICDGDTQRKRFRHRSIHLN